MYHSGMYMSSGQEGGVGIYSRGDAILLWKGLHLQLTPIYATLLQN